MSELVASDMKCIVCGAEGPSKQSEESLKWDWFTQYLNETVHFCPVHRESKERAEWWERSQKRPESLDEKKCPTCNGTGRVRRAESGMKA